MKFSKCFTQAVSGVVSGSILFTSCNVYNLNDDFLYESNKEIDDFNSNAIPISLKINPEGAEYIRFLQQLSEDIIDSPDIARSFYENPKLFLEKYGYNETIDLNDSFLKLILALGNEDILNAVQENDIKKFLSICKDQNLLNFDNDYCLKILDNSELRQNLEEFNIDISSSRDTSQEVSPILVLVVLVAVGLGFVIAYAMATIFITITKGFTEFHEAADRMSVFEIWTLKKDSSKTYVVVDEYLEDQINSIIDYIKENDPQYLKNNSEENLRAFMKINLLKY